MGTPDQEWVSGMSSVRDESQLTSEQSRRHKYICSLVSGLLLEAPWPEINSLTTGLIKLF